MLADARDGVALLLVDLRDAGLTGRGEDVDARDDQRAPDPATAPQLVLDVVEAWLLRACPQQRLAAGALKLAQQRGAVDERPRSIAGGEQAVARRGGPIGGRQLAQPDAVGAVSRRARRDRGGADDALCADFGARTVIERIAELPRAHHTIARIGIVVTTQRRVVTELRGFVALGNQLLGREHQSCAHFRAGQSSVALACVAAGSAVVPGSSVPQSARGARTPDAIAPKPRAVCGGRAPAHPRGRPAVSLRA